MAKSYLNGFSGNITFGSGPTSLDVADWTLNANCEVPDTTNSGDAGWESNIVGAKNWEGNFKTYWDSAAVPTGAAGFTNGARGTLTLNVGTSGKSYVGTATLTQVSVENVVKGVVTFNVNYKGTGALTMAS